MQSFHSFLLPIHILAGTISLLLFWIPVAVKKGSPLHNRVGQVYTAAMTVVIITAALMSIADAFLGRLEAAAFLGYLSILTGYALYVGFASVKIKGQLTDRYIMITRLFMAVLVLGGLGLVGLGLSLASIGDAALLYIFASIGLLQIRDLLKSTEQIRAEYTWIIEHLRGMMISGVAAHTAFAAFGGRQLLGELFDGYLMIIPWVLPTVIGVMVIEVMKKKYLPQGRR